MVYGTPNSWWPCGRPPAGLGIANITTLPSSLEIINILMNDRCKQNGKRSRGLFFVLLLKF
jgi:hypothetical protein